MAISADGEYIVAGSDDNKVYLFDKDSSTPIWNYTTGMNVNSVSISADGTYFSAGSDDNSVYKFTDPDIDRDGVVNSNDNCPDTAQGFLADENGCSASQRDTDEDGLVDSLDQCPGTGIGIVVDDVGCWWGQFDTDGDGIQNSEDFAPNGGANLVQSLRVGT